MLHAMTTVTHVHYPLEEVGCLLFFVTLFLSKLDHVVNPQDSNGRNAKYDGTDLIHHKYHDENETRGPT